jgi:hypothetical protein
MKNSFVVLAGTAVLFYTWAGASLAQDTNAPPPKPAATAAQSDSSVDMDAQMARMDEHMEKMQALHERMAGAATPEERQQVMAEQRQEMQNCMAMMKPMMHGGGMMGGKGGGMMGQEGSPADADARMKMMQGRMDMMQKRMDMMHVMMQSMLDQQNMMTGSKGKGL